MSRLRCWERLILVRDSNIHSAHVSSPRAQVPGHSSQKQKFAPGRGPEICRSHVGLISSSVAPQGTFPSTKQSNYPWHSRSLYSSHSSRGRIKLSRSQTAEHNWCVSSGLEQEKSVLACTRCALNGEVFCQDKELWEQGYKLHSSRENKWHLHRHPADAKA